MIPFHYRPIWSRVGLDILTLGILAYAVSIPIHPTNNTNKLENTLASSSSAILLLWVLIFLCCFITHITTGGWRVRWTISFPLSIIVPLQILKCCLYSFIQNNNDFSVYSSLIQIISWSIIFISFVLSIVLFPPVQLKSTDGPYCVGVVDIHIPIISNKNKNSILLEKQTNDDDDNDNTSKEEKNYKPFFLVARMAYPLLQQDNDNEEEEEEDSTNTSSSSSSSIPFLPTNVGEQYCNLFIQKGGAPTFIQKMTFLLQHWRLIRIHRVVSLLDVIKKKKNKNKKKKILNPRPCIVFSHGLTGNAITYSYITLNLASHGYCVVSLDHTDGSALHVFSPNNKKKNSNDDTDDDSYYNEIPYDNSLSKYDTPNTMEMYVKGRRNQCIHRVEELITWIHFIQTTQRQSMEEQESKEEGEEEEDLLLSSSSTNVEDHNKKTHSIIQSVLSNIIPTKVIGIGHSFGGATVLSAVSQYPHLFHSVIALDPAMDWMSDPSRWYWFGKGRCKEYKGGTGGYYSPSSFSPSSSKKLDNDYVSPIPSYFVYSEEWSQLGWGGYPFIQSLHQQGFLGPASSSSTPNNNNNIRKNQSDVTIIHGSSHMAFSDICMLIPTWIGRSLGLTGTRNPHDVSEEICQRIFEFLKSCS